MQLNVIVGVLLLEFTLLKAIYSIPLRTVTKGYIINELIRYYEPAMYAPEEVKHFHNRRRREVGGVSFNKPLRISFRAHDRYFHLILRSDNGIFADDVVFDTTARTIDYDTKRVYTGVLEGEDGSLVQGILTKEGYFDGTIFSKNEIFYVEPVLRYTPSSFQHQNSTSPPRHFHTIIYKTTDVKIPPSLNNPCASQILYLSRAEKETVPSRQKRSSSFRNSDIFSDRISKKLYFNNALNNSKIYKRNFTIPHHFFIKKSRERGVSSLPMVNSHDEIIESNILKTYIHSEHDNRTRKKVNVTSTLKCFKQFNGMRILLNNNFINRPRMIFNKTLPETKKSFGSHSQLDEMLPNGTSKHVNKRATIDPKKTTCMLYLQADHLFYQKYGTEEACIEVMTRHVQRVNSIYKSTDFNQDGKSDNISFMIKRIKVHTSESSRDPSYRFPGNYGVEKFLELFSEEDYDAFCLAYMFTYRDFEMGTLGLAWTGDLKNAGGVCEKNGHYRGSLKSLNTGIVTLLNYGKHVPPAVSHVTLAHEIGHNFGSPHDPESCTPGGEDGNYIMFARATSGDKKNNNKFSPCSLNSINPVLNSKARSQMGCFTEPQISICGNGVVEAGEDCDCGWEEDCRDSCCYPQRRYPPAGEPPCKLTPNSICSPSQGPCCTSECQLKFGDKCRDDNGCRDSSYCDGRSASCPPSVNKPNKTICNDEFVCFMGECTGSICLAYGLESCQCIPGPKDSSTKACELCCKKPGDDQPCISSFDWNESPYDVPDMFSKPGTPCNDYNGYCDVFQKCREVDPSGPLATLRKLLLSEESLASFKRWVTEHWYAVLIIVVSIIFLLVLSTKLLGKNQGTKLKSVTIIHSSTAETVRLPSSGDAGLTVHPPAIRKKLPLHRKVREKKHHTKVVPHKKGKEKQPEENKEEFKSNKENPTSKVRKCNLQRQNVANSNDKQSKKDTKILAKEYKRVISQESGKSPKSKTSAAKKLIPAKKTDKMTDEVCPTEEELKIRIDIMQNTGTELDKSNTKFCSPPPNLASSSVTTTACENPENLKMCEDGFRNSTEIVSNKIRNSRMKRPSHSTGEVEGTKKSKEDKSEKKETKSPAKVTSKKNLKPKMPKKKKKKKAEVLEYNNGEMENAALKENTIPSQDSFGKVQNWLMHSISVGKTSENFGIMTLTLPKSKSSPVGFSGNAKANEIQTKASGVPKIIHKNDKVVQIPKLTQKKSRSTGNLKKSDKRDEKMKLQVVYKPPFKFSVKLRNNKILGTVATKILAEKGSKEVSGSKNSSNFNEKVQRVGVLVRTSNRNPKGKQNARQKIGRHVTPSPEKENSTENPFTFPSGVAPVAVVSSAAAKQLPIYLTDQVDVDSNLHTVPSDLDVLLSESKFLFSDA